MDVPPRSQRRHHHRRIRARMLAIVGPNPDPAYLGVMVSTHGKPPICTRHCGHRRRRYGRTIGERRACDAADRYGWEA